MSGAADGAVLWCITDSLGLPAAKDQPATEPAVSYLHLTSLILRASGLDLNVKLQALTGRTAPTLAATVYEEPPPTNLFGVLVQVGVADCAPRLLGPLGRRVVGRLWPPILRKWV